LTSNMDGGIIITNPFGYARSLMSQLEVVVQAALQRLDWCSHAFQYNNFLSQYTCLKGLTLYFMGGLKGKLTSIFYSRKANKEMLSLSIIAKNTMLKVDGH
jgi:hypothetical protein